VNVARGLRQLRRPARPALFLGGELGQLCDRLLRQQDGFDPIVTWTAAPTREILTVRTNDTAEQTAFFDPNPAITAGECDDLAARLATAFAQDVRWCVMSGSSPCAVTHPLYATLVQRARDAGIRTLVDTYGACLLPALQAGPDVVKMNRRECEEASGRPLHTEAAVRTALRWLLEFGVSCAAITFGPQGMVAAWGDGVCAWTPPPVNAVNPIGAGDAVSAGLIDAFWRDDPPEVAFPWAMACAVASVERWVACDFRLEEVEWMRPRIVECRLSDVVNG
jgi:fructose-1-phosphate kinase PfkB-like protein